MWLILKRIQKRKIHQETKGGSFYYYSILTLGSLFYAGQYSILHRDESEVTFEQQVYCVVYRIVYTEVFRRVC